MKPKLLLLAKPKSPPEWWPKAQNGSFAYVTVRGDGCGWTLDRGREHGLRNTRDLEDVRLDFEFEYEDFQPFVYKKQEV
jgi:hypothetical protein